MQTYLNYPIKYAVQELKINKGYDSNYEDVTFGFIVSKCYIINQNITYHKDGTNTQTYNVIFPYKDIHNFIYSTLLRGYEFNEKPITTIYQYNCNTVPMIFDTYEEASIFKEQTYINFKKIILSHYGTKYAKSILEEFETNKEISEKYEVIILAKTKELDITKKILNVKKLTLKNNNQR